MTKAKKIAAAVTACATILTAASAAAFVPNKGELEVTASAASTAAAAGTTSSSPVAISPDFTRVCNLSAVWLRRVFSSTLQTINLILRQSVELAQN